MAGSHHKRESQSHKTPTKQLAAVLGMVFVFFLAELIGGWWTGSLALLADAGHMFSDMTALGISLFAAWMSTRKGTSQQTFGYYRSEILAALANGSLLFLVAGGILHEAWHRFSHPNEILAGPMFAIAVGGLIVNLISLKILHGGHSHNLNLKGAWLHVLGDTLGSVGVIGAAIFVWQFHWNWADPTASVIVCLLIVYSAWNLVSEAARVLMEHAPSDVDVELVRQTLLSVPEVVDVHCLHVWTIATGIRSISAHLVVDGNGERSEDWGAMQSTLRDKFSLDHITLQVERQGEEEVCEHTENGACLLSGVFGEKPCNHHSH